MNQYVIDAFWNAAQSALTAQDIKGLKSVIAEIEAYLGDESPPLPKKVIQIDPSSIAKSVCAFLDQQDCFDRFMKSSGFCPTDFTTKQFREFLIADGQSESLSQIEEWKHRIGHVMEQYSDPSSKFYKQITRLKTRGHYIKNEYRSELPLAN